MQLAKYIHRNKRGSILIETALLLPILLILLAGAFEMGRYMLAGQKTSALAAAISDMIAQADQGISEQEINDIFQAIDHVSKPFDINSGGRLMVTGVIGLENNQNQITWQRCQGSLTTARSKFGTEGTANVDLPGNISLFKDDMAIISEVFLPYEPALFKGFMEKRTLQARAVYRPRYGSLETVINIGSKSGC